MSGKDKAGDLPEKGRVHDKFFKKVFGSPGNIKEFIKLNLPSKVVEMIKLETISRERQSYIDSSFSEYFTDLVFHAELKNETEGYLVFLLEHKSSVQRETVLQVFKYMARLWDDTYEKKNELPLIIPVVFYHGRDQWTAPQRLSGLFPGDIDRVKEVFPDFKFYLYTLEELVKQIGEVTTSELRLYIKALQVVNSKNEKEFQSRMDEYVGELNHLDREGYWSIVQLSLWYLLLKAEYSDYEEVIDVVTAEYPERRDKVMTLAEQLKEEGRKEGRKEGLKEGKKLIARRLLELDEDIDKIKKVTGLSDDEIEELKD